MNAESLDARNPPLRDGRRLAPGPESFDQPLEGVDSPIRILLVDMSKIGRKMVRSMLAPAGYEVSEAATGGQALDLLAAEYHHIVVTGLALDDMSGIELCRAIRGGDELRYTYLIVLSGQRSLRDVSDALEAGADEFMNKPIVKPLLLARVRQAQKIIDLEAKLKLVQMQSRDLLMKDALTEVFNRRRLETDLPSELRRAQRYKCALSVVIADLDFFKKINDTHGHLVGDRILKEVAQRLKAECRDDIDWVARYGGEEFVAVLPETNAEGAFVLAERMRQAIESGPFDIGSGKKLELTMSFGAAGYSCVPETGVSTNELLGQADLCLYQAKEQGRNRVCYERCALPDQPGLN